MTKPCNMSYFNPYNKTRQEVRDIFASVCEQLTSLVCDNCDAPQQYESDTGAYYCVGDYKECVHNDLMRDIENECNSFAEIMLEHLGI